MITIYKNIFSKQPHYLPIEKALERIKNGNSKVGVSAIRTSLDKERSNELKKNLPSVCFSGKFDKNRTDADLLEHSGYLILDFDAVEDVFFKKQELINKSFVYATWISPSGNGVKALVKIADGAKHREHFQALQEDFKEIDKSGINVSRVCYESYDENILINENCTAYKKTKKIERVVETQKKENNIEVFNNILKWLSNKGNAFVTGERNLFIFKLAGACSRFGISEYDCFTLCNMSVLANDNEFTNKEAEITIKSAYKQNSASYGSASFENEKLIDKITRNEIEIIDTDIYDLDVRPKDVIFGEDVKGDALNIYENGYEDVAGFGIPELDEYFKMKKGEITLLSGIGNYGKSTLLKFLLVLKVVKEGKKFAFFSPEDNPAQEFYHDLVEVYLGMDCTPKNPKRPSRERYERAYDFISKNIFYVYPKTIAPTPAYIKERFLELIIKEKIDGCIIDPFNQLSNDYGARSDKYLETFLSDCSRFAQNNNVFFIIVAHPKLMKKDNDGNYPCPDIYDIADGAMWNNKMDNIIVYHRPEHQTNPSGNICELHTKKIRRQKTVGKKGVVTFSLATGWRRFLFNGFDYIANAFDTTQSTLTTNTTFLTENIKVLNEDYGVVVKGENDDHPF
jgi:hypothetical protein